MTASRGPGSREASKQAMEVIMRCALKVVLAVVIAALALSAEEKKIDAARSTITIHVGKAGVLSFAGHEHWVTAPISSGVLDDSATPRVEFKVDAAKMQIKPEPKVDEKTRMEIQRDMQEKTLQSRKYPEIVFRSGRITPQGAGLWTVEGTLTLCGVSRPVTARVRRDAGAYVSHVTIKQTDFGITPVTAAGGTIRVKNELQIDLRIFSK